MMERKQNKLVCACVCARARVCVWVWVGACACVCVRLAALCTACTVVVLELQAIAAHPNEPDLSRYACCSCLGLLREVFPVCILEVDASTRHDDPVKSRS